MVTYQSNRTRTRLRVLTCQPRKEKFSKSVRQMHPFRVSGVGHAGDARRGGISVVGTVIGGMVRSLDAREEVWSGRTYLLDQVDRPPEEVPRLTRRSQDLHHKSDRDIRAAVNRLISKRGAMGREGRPVSVVARRSRRTARYSSKCDPTNPSSLTNLDRVTGLDLRERLLLAEVGQETEVEELEALSLQPPTEADRVGRLAQDVDCCSGTGIAGEGEEKRQVLTFVGIGSRLGLEGTTTANTARPSSP